MSHIEGKYAFCDHIIGVINYIIRKIFNGLMCFHIAYYHILDFVWLNSFKVCYIVLLILYNYNYMFNQVYVAT